MSETAPTTAVSTELPFGGARQGGRFVIHRVLRYGPEDLGELEVGESLTAAAGTPRETRR